MTDFSRYLIASDIDGTYLGPGSTIVQRNLTALSRFREGGGLFTLATGRIQFNIDPGVPFVRETLNAPAVLCNGAFLYDFNEKKAYCETLLSVQDTKDLLAFALLNKENALIQLSTREGLYFNGLTVDLEHYVSTCEEGVIHVCDPATWPHDRTYKMVLHGDPDRVTELRELAESHFGDRFGITTSGPRILELQARGCSKAVGLSHLRRLTASKKERILIACGDFENDLEMLAAADIAVCPSNAHPAVKAIADYELCACGEGLIADVIEKIEAGELIPKRRKEETI